MRLRGVNAHLVLVVVVGGCVFPARLFPRARARLGGEKGVKGTREEELSGAGQRDPGLP